MADPIFAFAGRKRLGLSMRRRWVKAEKAGRNRLGWALIVFQNESTLVEFENTAVANLFQRCQVPFGPKCP